MKKQNTIDFADLLIHAEKLGYFWNQAHDILDDFYPRYGARTVDISEIDDENYEDNDDAKKILKSFFKKNKVTEFVILPKSC